MTPRCDECHGQALQRHCPSDQSLAEEREAGDGIDRELDVGAVRIPGATIAAVGAPIRPPPRRPAPLSRRRRSRVGGDDDERRPLVMADQVPAVHSSRALGRSSAAAPSATLRARSSGDRIGVSPGRDEALGTRERRGRRRTVAQVGEEGVGATRVERRRSPPRDRAAGERRHVPDRVAPGDRSMSGASRTWSASSAAGLSGAAVTSAVAPGSAGGRGAATVAGVAPSWEIPMQSPSPAEQPRRPAPGGHHASSSADPFGRVLRSSRSP